VVLLLRCLSSLSHLRKPLRSLNLSPKHIFSAILALYVVVYFLFLEFDFDWSLSLVLVFWRGFALLLDGGSLFSGLGFDIQLSFGLWCLVVSTVPVALVVFPE
jgi:hypothetical protein